MQGKRRKLPGELKAKAALEALAGDKTTGEIASKYEVHPNQVSTPRGTTAPRRWSTRKTSA